MANEESELIAEGADSSEREAWRPQLARAREMTPLPEIEAAMPVLGIFSGLLARRHAPYKVGILRDLAGQPGARWRMREIQERVDWLKPDSVRRLVRELADAAVLKYDPVRAAYRLSPEARVVASFSRALTVAEIKHGRIIKVLTAAIRAAQAVGAPDEAAFQPFLDAIAILEEDYQEMRGLILDYSEEGLKLAALAARENVADMRELLEHDEEFFGRFQTNPRYMEMADRAHRALTALADLTDEVWIALFQHADEILRRGLNFDRQDIRELVATLSIDDLAAIIPGGLLVPAEIPAVDADAVFAALALYVGRPDVTHGLPEPVTIRVLPAGLPGRNDFRIAADELEEIAADGGAPLARWVAHQDWATAVRRMGAAVGAWSRYGPAGNRELRATLIPGLGLESIGRAGVSKMSPARIEPRTVTP